MVVRLSLSPLEVIDEHRALKVMSGSSLPLSELLEHLLQLANNSLALWKLPSTATARLINVSENATYLIETTCGHRSILRVHRKNYHTRRAIECELAWLDALTAEKTVTTPRYYIGINGDAIQEAKLPELDESRFLVLFHFVNGSAPDESGDMIAGFEELGRLAARCHTQAISWDKPTPFERLTWDIDTVFGDNPTWGSWRDGPEVTTDIQKVLENVETAVRNRLVIYGKPAKRYNLIHADMRLANLLVDAGGTRLIDFDDCGFGWLMYDFAAAISFIEDDPRIHDYKTAWIKGYRTIRYLEDADIEEIDTFIMLRRMALLAWIGSHIDAPEPQKLAAGFAQTTASLGQEWLDNLS